MKTIIKAGFINGGAMLTDLDGISLAGDVPANTIVVGVPAWVINHLDKEEG